MLKPKIISTLIGILVICSSSFSQDKNIASLYIFKGKQLFYFTTKDSLKIGVKDEDGKIIIPAKASFYTYNYQSPILEPTIELMVTDLMKNNDSQSPVMPISEVYNRDGEFLYTLQFFDNGSDPLEEGLRRYVKNGKIGFANKLGEKVLPANWNFATPFSYGYATVYTGVWIKKYDKGGEHWTIVPNDDNAEKFLINKKGERISPYAHPKSDRDYKKGENEYYPYPFTYNALEKKIIDSLENLDVLNDLSLINYGPNNQKREDLLLQFEIIEYPSEYSPYYILQGFRQQHKVEEMKFAIYKDGTGYYHYDDFEQELSPMKDWIIDALKYGEEYFQEYPDMPFRFDVKKQMTVWKNEK